MVEKQRSKIVFELVFVYSYSSRRDLFLFVFFMVAEIERKRERERDMEWGRETDSYIKRHGGCVNVNNGSEVYFE